MRKTTAVNNTRFTAGKRKQRKEKGEERRRKKKEIRGGVGLHWGLLPTWDKRKRKRKLYIYF